MPVTILIVTFCFITIINMQSEMFTMAISQSNSSVPNQSNENKSSVETADLTRQQVIDILDQQEGLSISVTPKSSGWSGISFWNCSSHLANIWYYDETGSRQWTKHGQIGPQSVGCPRGAPQITLSFVNGHTYDVVVSMRDLHGCDGDWPRDYECGHDFLYNQYGNSSQIKWPYNIYN